MHARKSLEFSSRWIEGPSVRSVAESAKLTWAALERAQRSSVLAQRLLVQRRVCYSSVQTRRKTRYAYIPVLILHTAYDEVGASMDHVEINPGAPIAKYSVVELDTCVTFPSLNSPSFRIPQATTAAAALGVGIAVSPGSSTAADGGAAKGLPASGYFVQHAVFKVRVGVKNWRQWLKYDVWINRSCRDDKPG